MEPQARQQVQQVIQHYARAWVNVVLPSLLVLFALSLIGEPLFCYAASLNNSSAAVFSASSTAFVQLHASNAERGISTNTDDSQPAQPQVLLCAAHCHVAVSIALLVSVMLALRWTYRHSGLSFTPSPRQNPPYRPPICPILMIVTAR